MSADPGLRIGDVARLAGTTPRTIRYYEEIGLLPGGGDARAAGAHRLYGEADVERLREVMRLKSLLGVSLDELRELIAAEDARAAVRTELRRGDVDPERRRDLLVEAKGHLERQLELVRRRQAELAKLEADLADRRERVLARLREQGDAAPQAHEDEPPGAPPEPAPAAAGRS
jgi:DNA-binding transcriptional MerR regulator